MNDNDQVLVIGAGVIGLSCGYYLQRAGYRVTLIDKGRAGEACSHANCGYVCPCHVLPLTEPAALWTGLKSMFQPDAPFKIKPRLDPRLWRWLLRFALRCRRRPMLEAGHALKAILDASMDGYHQLLDEESIDCEWRRDGLLYVFRTAKGLDGMARTETMVAREFGVAGRRLDNAALRELDPAYREDLAGAFLYDHDAALRPEHLNAELKRLLLERGATLLEDCGLKSVRKETGRVVAVLTDRGELEAGEFVVATGAWSPSWEREFEVRLPVQPGKGYSITLDRTDASPRMPALLSEHRVGLSPLQGALRVGSMMEFSGYDDSIPQRRLDLLRDSANLYLTQPVETTMRASWYGWRPMTFDSLPIIGRAPRLANVTLATGHNMLGLTLAPATGKLVAEFIAGETPHIDPAPYRPERF